MKRSGLHKDGKCIQNKFGGAGSRFSNGMDLDQVVQAWSVFTKCFTKTFRQNLRRGYLNCKKQA